MKAALLLAVWLSGCAVDSFCLNCDDQGVVTDDAAIDGGDDADNPDSGCDPARIQEDPSNCGACGVVCPHAHGIPVCTQGVCGVKACDVGWVDLDGKPENDCEYACLESGPEICDGVDNDCNGTIDEGFDTQADAFNCGACGLTCAFSNGSAVCDKGLCKLGVCDTGYVDIDPLVEGCEYRCPVYPPLNTEICNGIDDNCDGQVDEPAHLETAPTTLCVTRAGSPCAGTVANCEKRGGVTTWYCGYGVGVEFDPSLPNGLAKSEAKCDGFDGDCNGIVDDSFTSLNSACDNGLKGACRDVGQVHCDLADSAKTVCDLSVLPDAVPGAPHVETCNNVDDDCDGVVDNTTGPTRLVQDMVHVTNGATSYYIDRWEASRPDATDTAAGVVGTRSCSKPNVLPWTQVPFAVAQAACVAAGLRLCLASEWQFACDAGTGRGFPYGTTYVGQTCNGADFVNGGPVTHALIPTGSALAPMCISGGVHDLSGNVKEWTNDQQGMTTTAPIQPIYVVRGGSYESPQLGLTCQTTFAQASADTSLSDVGFRCCSTTAP